MMGERLATLKEQSTDLEVLWMYAVSVVLFPKRL